MAETETEQLLETIGILRTHCAWTRALTHQSLRTYLVEEAYEVIDAIGAGNPQELRDELGDLLLQIVLHAQIASEAGQFGFDDVAYGCARRCCAATGTSSTSTGSCAGTSPRMWPPSSRPGMRPRRRNSA
ncbi:MazG nucleotide pyrophosphohydrolase domain-containing protein, partial [Arthrobacter sp. JCM 19049]|uniref:MazG nucleotide pyrophosphohydrolase domain-containing protein n=1 Tax=Arthrobacter sp. JCM 19049 TaxID=1460643 RepID=UPI0024367C14